MFANVIAINKGKHTDSFYTYSCGNLALNVGDKVIIPFGTKTKEGYVVELLEDANLKEGIVVKEIIEKAKYGHLNSEMISTALFIKKRYAVTYFDAINLFVPNGKPPKEGKEKEPYKDLKSSYVKPVALTEDQEKAKNRINTCLENNEQKIFLIHGVTSSGKTEVYMEAISKALELGKTAIMLVPEISLTRQTIERFIGRFGKENVAILHSKLTLRERFDEWTRLRTGKAKIAIGARMAVFAPLDNLGLIVMDEEHEATYKADMSPKYETIDVATKRLMSNNGVLLLGSATPSVVSYERAKEGIFELIELKERYNKTPLPKVEIVDMIKELRNGNDSLISSALYTEIKNCLDKKKQVILLQNRRGYSNYVSCMECGNVLKCKECGITLTYHKSIEKMVCHYCGRKLDVPSSCPECKSKHMKYIGIGTEQVLEEVSLKFPTAKVSRLDLDAIANRKELDNILYDFEKKETDILVGTQLVAKGLDFDNVGVCGVISSDSSLNIPDYRSTEKTFQLITQVAGRSGRGSEQGKVIVQTFDPDNFIFKSIKDNDYESFFNEEVKSRELLNYPPFTDIICVNFTSSDENVSKNVAIRCETYLKRTFNDKAMILSPKISTSFKGKDAYRQYILIKAIKGERNMYLSSLEAFDKKILKEKVDVNINIDVNPY